MTEIQDAKLSVPAGVSPDRALRVSRLIFDHLQRTLDREGPDAGNSARVVPHLLVPPLEIDWDATDDDGIARAGAAWVYRWLLASR